MAEDFFRGGCLKVFRSKKGGMVKISEDKMGGMPIFLDARPLSRGGHLFMHG